MQKTTREHAYKILNLLKAHYPKAKMILKWSNNWELLVSIILSAQCTDKKVNEVTSVVFPKYKKERPDLKEKYKEYDHVILASEGRTRPESDSGVTLIPRMAKEQTVELVNFAYAPLLELEQDIKSTGFYHNKAKNVQAAAKVVLHELNGNLPKTIKELTKIPGVGRKTANVFLGNAYGIYEGIAVDTHVTKQSQLLGLTKETTPEKIEQDLMKLFEKNDWFALTYLLIEHGRNMRRKKFDRYICDDKKCILCNSK